MRLNQVTLAVSDLARAVAFYKSLGLQQIVAADHYARFALPEGGSTLSVEVHAEMLPSSAVVYLEVDDVDEVVRRLQAAGLRFDQEPADQRWLWREARLHDPDGNPLCIFKAGVNRLNPPWRLPQSKPS